MKIQTLDTVAKVMGGVTPKGFSGQSSDGDIPFFKVSDMNSLVYGMILVIWNNTTKPAWNMKESDLQSELQRKI